MRMKRECFAVLLIVNLILHDPVITRSCSLEHDMRLWREQNTWYGMTDLATQQYPDDLAEYQIRYYLNGGTCQEMNPATFREENLPMSFARPKRAGYNFAGWYADSRYKRKVSRIEKGEVRNYSLYAKWTKEIDGDYNIQMYSYQNKAASRRTNKKLKDCRYGFLDDIQIPGMPSTREDDAAFNRITDTSVCPQGICLAGDYFLVSAYTTNRGKTLGCIHVFNRYTGEYFVTLGMKKESHLGGLTFDGESVWVCHSDNNTLECIPYDFIKRLCDKKPRKVVDCTAWFDAFSVSNSPSCITYCDGKIWVATHTKFMNSVMISYVPTETGLKKLKSYRIPDKVQGVAFDEKGRVYFSTSYGRKKSSHIKVYDSLERLDEKPGRPIVSVEMPPCSEEIVLEDDTLYILFESASEKYFEGTDGRGNSLSPIDKILALSKASIFQ